MTKFRFPNPKSRFSIDQVTNPLIIETRPA